MSASAYLPLRVLVGVLCVFFSFYLGRALAARARGLVTNAQLMRWALRVAVTGLAAGWAGIDRVTVAALALALATGGAGYYLVWRPQPPKEDLTKKMFPKD